MIPIDFIYERPDTVSNVNPNEVVTDEQMKSITGVRDYPIEFSTDIFDLLSNPTNDYFSPADPTAPPTGVVDPLLSSYYNNPSFVTQINLVATTRYLIFKVLGPSSSHSVTTTLGGDFESPIAGTITEIGAWVDTAGTTGTAVIDVNKNGTTLMSTNKVRIETTEKSSRNASTQPGVTTTNLAVGDLITVDIDTIQTTPAKGLTVRLTIN